MCIFCEIINGNIPSYKVYEDDKYLAILDISQATYGHTLVMPKKHYDNMLEMPEDEVKELMALVHKLSKLFMIKLDAHGINILNNTNEIAGQTVMHTHVHIIPRYNNNDTVKFEFNENKFDLNEVLKRLSN